MVNTFKRSTAERVQLAPIYLRYIRKPFKINCRVSDESVQSVPIYWQYISTFMSDSSKSGSLLIGFGSACSSYLTRMDFSKEEISSLSLLKTCSLPYLLIALKSFQTGGSSVVQVLLPTEESFYPHLCWSEPPECIRYIAIYFVLPSECNIWPAN